MLSLPSYILLAIFRTPEFYVIVSVVAAAVVALMSLPERKGEVKLHLLAGELVAACDRDKSSASPGLGSIRFECHAGNKVSLRRSGLHGVTMNGAVSLAVKVSGFDIVIEERVTPGEHTTAREASAAVFLLDFLAPEWYHIRYESERFGEHASLTLHVREGIVVSKGLIH